MNARKGIARQLAVILLFSLVTLSSAAAPSWNGTMGTENGWPLVSNPMQSMEGDQTIVAEEVWRLGDEDDEQGAIFGLIGDGVIDEEGNTYLLDTHLTTIYKVGPDGEILENIGREGDGPGEFRNVMNMMFMPDGNLGIFEMMPGRIVTMGRAGQPLPSYSFGDHDGSAMQNIAKMAADKNSVVIGLSVMEFKDGGLTSTHSLGQYAPDGKTLKTLFQEQDKQSGGTMTLGGGDNDFTRYWTLDSTGRVVVFQDDEQYKLEVFGPDGEHEMIIRRKYEPVHRSDKDIKRDERQQEALRKRFIDSNFPPVRTIARHISDAFARPNGDLWVQNSEGDRDCPENAIGYFDVFNHDGQYVKRVLIQADYDPERDNFKILGDHLLVFKEAQKAPERTATSGGGGMQMVMVSGATADPEDEDEEPMPYEVVFYRLP